MKNRGKGRMAVNINKKKITAVRINGRLFLLKKEPPRAGRLYLADGFRRDCVLSSLLWKKGICPKTLCGPGWMLQEKMPRARQLGYAKDAALAGKLLANLHSIRIDGGVAAALGKKDYVKRAYCSKLTQAEKRRIASSYPALSAALDALFRKLQSPHMLRGKMCICHHDAVAQNFLICGKKGFLIDFEWATLDYFESDLASFLSPFAAAWSNQVISAKDARLFISSYCKARGLKANDVMAGIESASPFILFTHLCWAARILLSHPRKAKLTARENAELAYARRCLRLLLCKPPIY